MLASRIPTAILSKSNRKHRILSDNNVVVNSKMTKEEDKKYWVALSKNQKIGSRKFKKIMSYFKTARDAWERGTGGDFKRCGLDEKTVSDISELRKSVVPEEEWEKIEKENISIITTGEKNYPKNLSEIYDPPAVIFLKGKILPEDEFAIAIVGSRKVTSYGGQITPRIAEDLAEKGMTIVSGLALGVDALAHSGALNEEGRTIAVLGCGIDDKTIYPPSNRKLAKEIMENGAILSEYPPETPPLRQHFPARNRIISGLSLGTLVIEANEVSGALITARSALDQNRAVFAVPGRAFDVQSTGPNNLIKMGAKLVTSAEDVMNELELKSVQSKKKTRKIYPDTKEEEIILKVISHDPLHIDTIARESRLAASKVSSVLTMMEMKGKVKNLGGAQYVLGR